jgi:sterol desaturase/sphingolipid hydroxylase (fatty acid hydroxylase superfamily)
MKVNTALLIHALPGLLILMAVEILHMTEDEMGKNKRDILTSIVLGTVAGLLNVSTQGVVIVIYTFLYKYRLMNLSSTLWWVWVICFFADEFSYYWYHRISHQIRFLWASHCVHHSSENYTLASGVRLPWTSYFSGNFIFWAWMPLVGIEPGLLMFFKSIAILYQFWLHTEKIKKLPNWYELIFNTPSHHRVHHSSNLKYLDKNHSGTLIIWDKLFGTFQGEHETAKYGLTKNIGSYNPLVIAFFEWKNIIRDIKKSKNSKETFNYLFNSPGWSPDGSSKTRKQLQLQTQLEKSPYFKQLVGVSYSNHVSPTYPAQLET